jgi:uncharacterized membrane protein
MTKRLLLPLALALLGAGCASAPRPFAPVRSVAYQALGSRSYWVLTIGDDRIVFYPVNGNEQRIWPRVLPRLEGETRIWESGAGTDSIRIEARSGPCADRREHVYEDVVTIRMGSEGPELLGCGGRRLRDRS